jgi:hypothetical protein
MAPAAFRRAIKMFFKGTMLLESTGWPAAIRKYGLQGSVSAPLQKEPQGLMALPILL